MKLRRKSTVPIQVRKSKLADALPRAELRRLDQIGTIVAVDEGEEIIVESTLGRECFVIVDGEFSVIGSGFSARAGAGDVTGELAMLTGSPRRASVVAASDSVVYAFHQREFATLLSEATEFRSQVVATANARLGEGEVTLPAQFVRNRRDR